MRKLIFMAGSALGIILMAGCAELADRERDTERENERAEHCDPALIARFDGNWKVERSSYKDGKLIAARSGNISGEMIGENIRLSSPELKMELIFGLSHEGKYVLVDLDSARSQILTAKYTDDEEEDGDRKEFNDDINLEAGENVLGEIKFLSPDMIEILYFREQDEEEILLEKICLTRTR